MMGLGSQLVVRTEWLRIFWVRDFRSRQFSYIRRYAVPCLIGLNDDITYRLGSLGIQWVSECFAFTDRFLGDTFFGQLGLI